MGRGPQTPQPQGEGKVALGKTIKVAYILYPQVGTRGQSLPPVSFSTSRLCLAYDLFSKSSHTALFSFTTTTCLPPGTWEGGEVQHQTTYWLQGWIPQGTIS